MAALWGRQIICPNSQEKAAENNNFYEEEFQEVLTPEASKSFDIRSERTFLIQVFWLSSQNFKDFFLFVFSNRHILQREKFEFNKITFVDGNVLWEEFPPSPVNIYQIFKKLKHSSMSLLEFIQNSIDNLFIIRPTIFFIFLNATDAGNQENLRSLKKKRGHCYPQVSRKNEENM